MKISYIELCGFRGFRDRARLDFADGFVVVTGRNGAGKSTVLDAFDFALTGTINKYRVRGAKGGGLAEHIWWGGEGRPAAHYVSVGFTDDSGDEFVVTRSRAHGLEVSRDEIRRRLTFNEGAPEGWEDILVKTTLLRDETIAALSLDLPEQARFNALREAVAVAEEPGFQERTKAVHDAAVSQQHAAEKRLQDVKTRLSRRLTELTETRSQAEAQRDFAEAIATIERIAPKVLQEQSDDRLEALRRFVASEKNRLSKLSEIAARAQEVSDALREARSTEVLHDAEAARRTVEEVNLRWETAKAALAERRRLESVEREADAFAAHMIALLEHGTALGLQDGHCPLCDAVHTNAEFRSAVSRAARRLEARGTQAQAALSAVREAEEETRAAESAHAVAVERLTALEAREDRLLSQLAALDERLASLESGTAAGDVEGLQGALRGLREEIAELEVAHFALETSAAHDRVAAIERDVGNLREELEERNLELAASERVVERTNQVSLAAREVPNQLLAEQFDTVLPLLRELYQRLRPHNEWREIEADFGGRVRASLNLTVGEQNNPQFIFSSGQRRAAGIAFLLSVLLSRSWSPLKTVLLDDPIQHIDDYRAVNLVEVLSAVRRTGRQIVVSVEDVALADLLCRRLRSTVSEPGRRFELSVDATGTAVVAEWRDIPPLPTHTLQYESA